MSCPLSLAGHNIRLLGMASAICTQGSAFASGSDFVTPNPNVIPYFRTPPQALLTSGRYRPTSSSFSPLHA